jgi:RNA polymerase sigma-70 factor (ECF subfamily)
MTTARTDPSSTARPSVDPSSSSVLSTPGVRIPEHFVTTHISFLCRARDATEPERSLIFDRICQAYWHPVYAYIRRSGKTVEDSKDCTQEFFFQIIQRGFQYDPAKGRFRSYLLGAVKHFLSNRHKHEYALKRKPVEPLLSIDEEEAERRLPPDANQLQPDQAYEKSYALALLETVHSQLKADYARSGKAELFAVLQPYLATHAGGQPYKMLALQLEKSEDAVKQQIKRMRLKFQQFLELEISRNVADPADIEHEKSWLKAVFR